jgi:hypothetical protein
MAKPIPEKNQDDITSMYRYSFNTPIPPSLQEEFSKWIKSESGKNGKDLMEEMDDYDVQGYWLDTKGKDGDLKSEKYKKPNHPTFSTESMYNDKDFKGGTWEDIEGVRTFTPGKQNLQNMPREEMKIYFDVYEKGTKLNLVEEKKE